jgi:acid phosphatase
MTPTATASDTTAPVRAAFYYPWFPETWHATDHFDPSAGHYDSSDPSVVDDQFAAMAYGGLDAAISSWWGQGQHAEDTRFPLELTAAANHGMGVAPYYEKEGTGDTPLATIRSDLAYLDAYAQANPDGFLHVDGKPVIFVSNAAASTATCADVAKWKTATNGFTDWYVNMKVFPGYASCADQPSGWHQYGPARATDQQGSYSYSVSPGYDSYTESTPRLTRDLGRFESDLASMVASKADWQLVTTFNEWGDGTAVESATQWASPTGYGDYLDAMHDALAPTDSPTPSPTESPTGSPTTSTATLSATADTYTDEDVPRQNFGSATALAVDGQPVRRAWFEFDLPGQPTAASLTVYPGTSSSRGLTVNTAPSTWTESGLTAANAPALGPQVGSTATVTGGAYQTIQLDPSTLTSGSNTLVVSRAGKARILLSSRDSTRPPSLTVTYGEDTTPPPSPTPTPAPTPTPTPTPTATPTPTPSPTATPTPTPTPSPTATPTPPDNAVTKLLVFMEENHSLDEMQTGMPYTFSLAQQYGYATHYTAITHPSLPNYLAIAAGTTSGVTDDNPPSSHPLSGPSVFGQALAAGRTAKTYADSMTSNCQQSSSGQYAVKHNPWAYYTDPPERSGCNAFDVPIGELASDAAAGTLPNVGMVVPNLCNDAHDCSLATADGWFKTQMQDVFAGPDWRSGHLAVVLTADEDDKSQGNTVLTVVIHPSQNGNVVTTPLTHYSLTRLYEEVAHTGFLNNAATAPDLASAFGLPVQ